MNRTLAIAASALALGTVGIVAGSTLTSSESSSTPTSQTQNCEDWIGSFTSGECFAAGIIRFVFLTNVQGAAQFCKWKGANPGEWSRLNNYAQTGTTPTNIITWFGAALKNMLESYFATGAPAFTIQPNTAPNICKTPLSPPQIVGVTPGQTQATVTVTSP